MAYTILKTGKEPQGYEPVVPLPEEEKQFPQASPMARMGKGIIDVGNAAKQLGIYALEKTGQVPEGWTQSLIEELASDEEMYQKTRGKDAGSWDWMRILGQSLPLMAAGTLLPTAAGAGYGRVALTSAAGGGGAGLFMPAQNPEKSFIRQKTEQVATGAVSGGILGPVAVAGGRKVLTPLGRRAFNYLARYASTDKISPAVLDSTMVPYMAENGLPGWSVFSTATKKALADTARKQLDIGALDKKALVRQAVLSEVGVTKPTLAQLTRDPAQWRRMIEISKMDKAGTPIRERLMEQRQELGKYAGDLGRKIYDDFQFSEYSKDVMADAATLAHDTLNKAKDLSQKAVGAIYDEIPEEIKKTFIKIPNLRNLLDGELQDVELVAPVVGYARTQLENKFPWGMTVESSDLFRKRISGMISTGDPTTKRFGKQIIDAIDEDVFSALGDSPYAKARSEASRRFKQFGSKLMQTITGDVEQGDRFVNSNIIANTPKGLQTLKETLTEPDIPLSAENAKIVEEEGRNAWNAIRGAIYNHILSKGMVKEESDMIAEYSGAKIASEVKRIGWNRLNVILEPDEREALKLLMQAGTFTTKAPADAAINRSNTASATANLFVDILDQIPGIRRVLGKTSGYRAYRDSSQILNPERGMPSRSVEKWTRSSPVLGPSLIEENKR